MAFVPYISADDLCVSLSQSTYMALFDDLRTNDRATVDVSAQVTQVRMRAHAAVMSWLPAIYKTMPNEPPLQPPYLLVDAELFLATVFAYRRHSEYVRTYGAEPGGKMYAEWVEMMRRIQSAETQIAPTDNAPEGSPETIGTFVVNGGPRLICDNADGSSNGGDF